MEEELKTIATFDTPTAAGFVRSRLEAEGITVFSENMEMVGMAWHLGNAVGGIKLKVLEEDAERATALLNEMRERPPVEESNRHENGDMKTEMECPDEDESQADNSSPDEIIHRAFRCALLGMLFLPLQLYTLWLVGRIILGSGKLEQKHRVRMAAIIVMLALIVAVVLIVLDLMLS